MNKTIKGHRRFLIFSELWLGDRCTATMSRLKIGTVNPLI